MSDHLKKILENFCRLDNVRGAVILDDQGLVVEEFFANEGEDSSPLAMLVLRSLQVGSQLVDDLQKAPLTQQYIEFSDVQITAEQLANNCVLVILAETGANLGRVRLEIRKNKGAVETLLA